jgi:hypothetical protein
MIAEARCASEPQARALRRMAFALLHGGVHG